MALLGSAALAMWWDMAHDMRDEFQHWHTHEHFPERLSVPGFLRASRWEDANGGEGFFIMYEVRDFDVLTSKAYLDHLNSPTPWSTKLMPHHRNMVRSQCRVVHSEGGAVAGHAVTVRLHGGDGIVEQIRGASLRPGIGGVHLLHAQVPTIAQTTEQKIRGGNDKVADWIALLVGYDAQALEAAAHALPGTRGAYRLAMSMAATEKTFE
jgi:hypothetical protein